MKSRFKKKKKIKYNGIKYSTIISDGNNNLPEDLWLRSGSQGNIQQCSWELNREGNQPNLKINTDTGNQWTEAKTSSILQSPKPNSIHFTVNYDNEKQQILIREDETTECFAI